MANPEHLKKLEAGVEAWNQWRKEYPDIKPELTGACIENWNISKSKFLEVKCDYIFRQLAWNEQKKRQNFCKRYPIEENKIFKPEEFERFVKRIEETKNSIWDNGINPPDPLKSNKPPEIEGVQERQNIQTTYNYHISRDLNMNNSNNINNQSGNFGIGINNGEIKRKNSRKLKRSRTASSIQ